MDSGITVSRLVFRVLNSELETENTFGPRLVVQGLEISSGRFCGGHPDSLHSLVSA